jgi:hypothetical protein
MVNYWIDLLVCIVGLVVFCIARPDNDKAVRLGYAMFCCGLLAFLFAFKGLAL